MERHGGARITACVGAVIGAGFASGREIVAIFTRYGAHAGWLIALSCAAMGVLCALCMRAAGRMDADCWCALYAGAPGWQRAIAQACVTLLLAVTGGAMVAASGHLVALLWPCAWAYPIGAVGTLVLAWWLGFGSMQPLSWVSGVLTALFVGAVAAALLAGESAQVVALPSRQSAGGLLWAAVRAVSYAAMNMTLAIGVVCRCAGRTPGETRRLSAGLGAALAALLLISNALYARHPELLSDAFPVVRVLSRFGRIGFVASVSLLYLAVFTSLIAVLYAMRGAAERYVRSPYGRSAFTLLPPLAVSCVGFEGIVDGLYAPAGLLCLVAVYVPLMRRRPNCPLTFRA